MKVILTIAGSDPSGGAGIQADLATIRLLGLRGISVITAVTAQNARQFYSVNSVSPKILQSQLDAVCDAGPFHAIKIGMLGTEENVQVVARFLKRMQDIPVILDPVFHSSTGEELLTRKGIVSLRKYLIPLATLVTPNLQEASILYSQKVDSVEHMKEAAQWIYKTCSGVLGVLIKGGHLEREVTDIFFDGKEWLSFCIKKKLPQDVHGTGCVLSAAIASYLAMGDSLKVSIQKAKSQVTAYIRSSLAQK